MQRMFHGPSAPGILIQDESQLATVLAGRQLPDVSLSPPAPQVGVVHRQTDYADIYFLANTSNKPVEAKATFRVEGAAPECWNPLTGQIKTISIVDRPAGGSTIAISLDAYESTLIVWTHRPEPATAVSSPVASAAPIDLSTDWSVQFGKDATATQMPALASWTDNSATKNYSGTVTYTKHVTIAQERLADASGLWLAFGPSEALTQQRGRRSGTGFEAQLAPPIREAATIYVNGQPAGSLWCSPYKLDLTHFLVAGDNTIRIDVSNTAINSIASHGFPNYDVRAINGQFGNRFSAPSNDLYVPVTSGILGSVQLVSGH